MSVSLTFGIVFLISKAFANTYCLKSEDCPPFEYCDYYRDGHGTNACIPRDTCYKDSNCITTPETWPNSDANYYG
jgi:hypothetical protein